MLLSHFDNALASACAAKCAAISVESIKGALQRSKGVPGRMELQRVKNWLIINDSNPSVDATSLRTSLENVIGWREREDQEKSFIVIFGGEERTSCVLFKYDEAKETIEKYKKGKNQDKKKDFRIFLIGEIGKKLEEMQVEGEYKSGEIRKELEDIIKERKEGTILLILKGEETALRKL